MFMKVGFLLLTVAVFQAIAEHTKPEFFEDVIKREAESVSTRIVSGWEAFPGEHPHQAALRMVDAVGGVSACGGSFVHREWVITAAHCTAQRITIVVRGGLVSLTNPEYIFETTEWWNHPTYNDNLPSVVQPNDISIMKLQRPLTYSQNLKAIRVQPSADAFRNYEGLRVHTSGHGRTWTGGATTEVLRWVYLTAVSNPTCAALFGTLITDNTICARWYNETSQSTCQGDSGGPLVYVNSEGVDVLIGVTSFVAGGDWGCHSGLPAGFIRTGPFLPWFQEVSGIDFENLQEEDEVTTTTTVPTTTEIDTTVSTTTAPTTPDDETTDPAPVPPPEDDESDEEDSDSSEEDSSSESSECDDDKELSELIKRLQVNVKVKVSINKYKVKKEVQIEKEKRRQIN